jgi:hypothetical protein
LRSCLDVCGISILDARLIINQKTGADRSGTSGTSSARHVDSMLASLAHASGPFHGFAGYTDMAGTNSSQGPFWQNQDDLSILTPSGPCCYWRPPYCTLVLQHSCSPRGVYSDCAEWGSSHRPTIHPSQSIHGAKKGVFRRV